LTRVSEAWPNLDNPCASLQRDAAIMLGKFDIDKNINQKKNHSASEIIFHDHKGKVLGPELKRKSKTSPIVSNFALAALDDEVDDETVTPSFYFNVHRTRLPSVPIHQMTEEKREQLYTPANDAEFVKRDEQLRLVEEQCQRQYLATKKRQMEMRAEMRTMLQQYLDLDRQMTEHLCHLENASVSRQELFKRFKKI
jgi:hypothetical protein